MKSDPINYNYEVADYVDYNWVNWTNKIIL